MLVNKNVSTSVLTDYTLGEKKREKERIIYIEQKWKAVAIEDDRLLDQTKLVWEEWAYHHVY